MHSIGLLALAAACAEAYLDVSSGAGLQAYGKVPVLRRALGRPGGMCPVQRNARMTAAKPCQGVGLQQQLDFERKGHIKLQGIIPSQADAEEMRAAVSREYMRRRKEAYVQKIRLFAAEDEDEDLYRQALQCTSEEEARELLESWCNENEVPVPFLQVFNVHRDSTPDAQRIRAFATSPRLGHVAASLLGVPSVRLYQTSVFMKERGHGETSWHADLATSPFDTNHMVTCWVALTPIQTEYDSPLEFASGSHRDLALPYWYTEDGMDNPSGDQREYDVDMHLPLAPGDATFHHGWLFHAAPPNDGKRDRLALAISYVSAAAHVLDVEDDEGLRRRPEDEDRESYADWLGEVPGGAVVNHQALPIVYPPPKEK